MTYIFPTGFFSETLPTDTHPLERLFSDHQIAHNCPILSDCEREILTNAHTYQQARLREQIAANGPQGVQS